MRRLQQLVLLFIFCATGLSKEINYDAMTLAKIVQLEFRIEHLENLLNNTGIWTKGRCPDGWTRFQTSCYFVPSGKHTFGGATFLCKQFLSSLVQIESMEENIFIQSHIEDMQGTSVWTGLKKLKTGKWSWYKTHKEPIFTDWGPRDPNNYGGDQYCVKLDHNIHFQWNDIACNMQYRALCEKNI